MSSACSCGISPGFMDPADMAGITLRKELEKTCTAISRFETRYTDPHKREYYMGLYPWRESLNAELRKRELGRG